MKKSIIALSIVLSSSLLANELSWVDEQVEAIKPTRIGMNISDLSSLKSPFIYLEKNQTEKKEPKKKKNTKNSTNKTKKDKSVVYANKKNVQVVHKSFFLNMVMNNSVMINNKWYKFGETVGGYTIKKLNYNSVLLVRKNKKLLLSTKSDNKKLKFQK